MITFVGWVIKKVAFFSPDLAREWRMATVDRIMSKYTDSYMQKLAVMNKLNKFMETMNQEEAKSIMRSLGIPTWTNEGNFRGML